MSEQQRLMTASFIKDVLNLDLPAFCSMIALGIRSAFSTEWRGYLARTTEACGFTVFFAFIAFFVDTVHPFYLWLTRQLYGWAAVRLQVSCGQLLFRMSDVAVTVTV
jgi:hypothetical protein